MNKNRTLLSLIFVIVAAIGLSSCSYRSSYHPGRDYGYRHYHHRYYYNAPPPPPRVVVVKPAPRPRRVIRAEHTRPSRSDSRHYRQQHNRGNHYGSRNHRSSPR